MAVIVTRAGKGSPLTADEFDANNVNLNAAIASSDSDISALDARVTTNETDIDTAEADILTNASDIVTNAAAIALNTTHRNITSGNPHNVTNTEVGLGNVTDDAQLKRAAADFTSFTQKTELNDSDVLLIEDSEDGTAFSKKYITAKLLKNAKGNGFVDAVGADLDSYFTIGVVGTTFTATWIADYDFVVGGTLYTKTANETVEITDVEGVHWIYFDSTGTIQIAAPGVATAKTLIESTCLIAGVYWDATNNQALLTFDERHGASMSPATHLYLHDVYGSVYDYGLGFTGFDADGSGNDATAAQFDLEAGEFHDEDNEVEIAADTDVTIPTFYKSGVGGAWRKLTSTTGYPVADGTIDLRLDYNDYNGGDWQLLEVTNNSFVCTHYFATNDPNIPIIGVMGESIYANANQARTGAETEILDITYNGLPLTEFIILGSVIWQTSDSYSNQVAARVISTDSGDDYIDWRQQRALATGGGSTNDHEALDNLLGGATGDHNHITSTEATNLTTLTDGSDADTLHNHAQLYSGSNLRADVDATNLNVYNNTTATELRLQAATNNAYVFSANDGDGLYLGAYTAAGSYVDGLVIDPDVSTQILHLGTKVLETEADGIHVHDASGNDPAVKFYDSSDGLLGKVSFTNGEMAFVSIGQTSTSMKLAIEGSGGEQEEVLTAAADGAVSLYYNGVKAAETRTDGLEVFSTTDDNPIIAMFEDDGSTLAFKIDSISGSNVYMQSPRHGGDLWLSAEDLGGTSRWAGIDSSIPSFEPSPDNSLSLGASGARWTSVWATDSTIETSSRLQKTLKGSPMGMQFIDKLKPTVYSREGRVRDHWGLVAEDVKEAMDELGVDFGCYIDPEFDGKPLKTHDQNGNPIVHQKGLRYGELISPIIKGLQELHTMAKLDAQRIKQLEDRVEALDNPTMSSSTKRP